MKTEIYSNDWDLLVILDACRYDVFSDVYSDYVAGKLTKKRSPGAGTPEFLHTVFTEPMDDVIYVSANPFVSSTESSLTDFHPDRLFHTVYDLWETQKDPELGATPPIAVTDKICEVSERFPEKRIIAHYIQPHVPFLSYGKINNHNGFVLRDVEGNRIISKYRNLLDNELKARFGKGILWQIKSRLGLPAATDMEIILRSEGNSGLRAAYEHNLRSALYSVRRAIQAVEEVILTADHGELLGENNDYGHGFGKTNQELREIPWLRVDKRKTDNLNCEPPQQRWVTTREPADINKSIEAHLADLGYV